MNIIILGLVLRIIYAFLNSFYGPFLSGDADAIKFHETAIAVSQDINNFDYRTGWIYASVLGLIYKISFDSIFFGSLISVLGWFVSAVIVLKTVKLLKIENTSKKVILLLFSFWPSAIIFTSIILRESFQLLFFTLAIFSFLKIFLENKNKYNPIFFASLVFLALLHKMFALYSIILFMFYVIFFIKSLKNENYKTLILFFLSVGVIIFFNIELISTYFYNKVPLDKKSFLEIVQNHINHMTVARASYQVDEVLFYQLRDFLKYMILSISNYFLQPFPSNQQLFIDFLLFFENLVRIFLYLIILINIFNIKLKYYSLYTSLFLLLLILEIGWALGTNNWGTAVRHHVPSMGLLLLLSFYNFEKPNR